MLFAVKKNATALHARANCAVSATGLLAGPTLSSHLALEFAWGHQQPAVQFNGKDRAKHDDLQLTPM
jgi:hypothetical protein